MMDLVSKFLCCSSKKDVKPNPPLAENQYTYSQVKKFTKKFSRVLGKGGFGVVYHGVLNDQQEIAVKMLNRASIYDIKQFTAEVHAFLKVGHRNLVSLIGYCDEGKHLALIYEFMENGDLKGHLSGKFGNVLSWESRLKIALEAAQGLEYLHNELGIIHRYVKPTNILLDGKLEAKLADFGMSRSSPTDPEAEASNKIYVNPGRSEYLDDEYFKTNQLTNKSDVYSFGIVLWEMITNQPVIGNNHKRSPITEWISFNLGKDSIPEIVDPRLNNDFETNSVRKAVEIALACAVHISGNRPRMSRIVMELNECLALEMARTHGRRGDITQETR